MPSMNSAKFYLYWLWHMLFAMTFQAASGAHLHDVGSLAPSILFSECAAFVTFDVCVYDVRDPNTRHSLRTERSVMKER